jgi:hypothetical protein
MKYSILSVLAVTGSLLLNSCVKQSNSLPPETSSVDPKLTTNAHLKDLATSALYLTTGTKSRVLGDTTIYGIVVGDDRSGNLYKKIVIQDSLEGGMTIVIDRTYLYADYPVGRKVYVKLKGLSLVNYKGTPEIVYSVNADATTNGIPTALIGNYIVKGNYPNSVTPTVVSLTDLYSNAFKYVNRLVEIDNMQFDAASAGTLYSDPNISTNRTIQDCAKTASLTMYNSSYATFQSSTTPTGNGSIVGLVSIYISTPQFVLRDTTDIKFTNPRCP